jgi:lipoprotein NlpD
LTAARSAGALISCLAIAACTPTLVDYGATTHVVRSGETLYTIAWRHGIDYRELARWNALEDPNLIYAGQELRLRPPERVAVTRTVAAPARRSPAPPTVLPQPAWSWPVRGRVVAGFGSSDGIGTGIAIAGTSGMPIVAAADGRVVYVGTGLAGYGQLAIVKHNDTYLSAYGHIDNVAVAQGDQVRRGQRIASMGLGPRRQARLHFEIRRNGVPIDPLASLPALP